jgi:hypothetical protein
MRERVNFPEGEYQNLLEKSTAYAAALNTALDPATRSKATVQAKDHTKKVLKQDLQQDIKEFLSFNRAVSDEDRDLLGLPIPKSGRTPVPAPTTLPGLKVLLPAPAIIEFHFFDAVTEARAKPFGVHGIELAWAILDAPPAGWEDLIHSAFDTHSPYKMTFRYEERGKTFYFAARWENTRGEKGPWTQIDSAIVP